MSLLTNVLKLWRTGQYLLPADSGFSPKHLFAGRVGWWLDPLDFRYARQDSAGTTPYTAVEQYAGLLLDKAVPQVSNGTARVNIIANSTNFASTADCVITNNKFVATAASGYHSYYTSALAPGAVYKVKLKVKAAEYTKLYISDMSYGNFAVAVDLVALTYSGAQRTATNISVTSLGSGIVEVQLTVTDYAGGVGVVSAIGYPNTGATLNFWGAQYTGDGVSGLYVYAVDVRLLSDEAVLPAYQRIDNNVWVPYSSGCFYQATSAARPVVSARANLLTKSGQFSVSPWTAANLTITPDGASPTPDAYSLLALTSTPNVEHLIEQSFTHPGNATYVSSFIIKPSTSAIATNAPVTVGSTSTVSISQHSISSGVVSNFSIYGIVSSQSSVYIGNGAYKISATYTTNGTVTSHRARLYPASIVSQILSPVAGIGTAVAGASVCFASRSNLPYQYVNTDTDYDTAGFPHYLKFDGIDDNLVSAAGGGGAAGIYFCGAIQFNKVGAVQTIFSDAGTNSGYKLRLTAANQLEIAAGNGTAYTAINTTDTFAVGDVALCEFWDDGTNIGVRLGNGTTATVARPAVSAGTAQITLGKANNAASEYSGVSIFSAVYLKDYCPTAAERADYKRWALQRAGVAS